MKNQIKVGDKVVVCGRFDFMPVVKSIVDEPETARTKIILDWGEFGESKVYLHDQDNVWYKYSMTN